MIIEKAAVVRFLSDTAATSDHTSDGAVLHGIGSMCQEIGQLTRRVKKALQFEALDT